MVVAVDESESRYDLAHFVLRDMIECGRVLRVAGQEAPTMERAAQRLVKFLHASLVDGTSGEPNCALVRCFKTHRYGKLPKTLREAAKKALTRGEPEEHLPCLTLLATAGLKPEWSDRHRSSGHVAIPLESVEIVERAPMIAALIRQMGLEIEAALYPNSQIILDADQHASNVFHVENAVGAPSIPAQDFVQKLWYPFCPRIWRAASFR